MGPNITCRALVLKTEDQAQSMYVGNLNKQILALITYIGPGPEVLLSDWPTIYNHAAWSHYSFLLSYHIGTQADQKNLERAREG